jgi:5-methylcytosine-specific restriction endonuclease McrA
MVRRYFSKPNVRYIFYSADNADYSNLRVLLDVTAKGRRMWSSRSLPVLVNLYEPELLQRFAQLKPRLDAARAAMKAFEAECPEMDDFKKLPLHEMQSRISRRKTLLADLEASRGPVEVCQREMANPKFVQILERIAIPLDASEDEAKDDHSYALYRGAVWIGERPFEREQWQTLVDRAIEREEAELAVALGITEPQTGGRERLSAEVRRAVWIRDQARCVRCGSRNRLEFDHIIPVVRGGGNTERNIELLCEACNRAKSDSIQ